MAPEVREMAEAANVRLVLCPKCEELLPEHPEFSIYKCGGCGAVLRAKGKGVLENGLPKIPDGVKTEEESKVKASEVAVTGEKLPVDHGVVTAHNEEGISFSQDLATDTDSHKNRIGKERIEFRGVSQSQQDHKKPTKNCGLNVDRPEYAYFHENVGAVRNPMDSVKSRPAMDRWDDRTCESGPSRMHTRGLSEQFRVSDFPCHEEGGDMSKYSELFDRARYLSHNNGGGRAENLEIDRMDLLRRLDELRDQLSRSNNDGAAKYSSRVASDFRVVSPASPVCYGGHNSSNSQGLNNPPLVSDEMGPHYFSHACTKSHGSQLQDFYGRRGCSHEFRQEMPLRPSSYHPQQMQQAYDHRFPHYYGEANQDLYSNRHGSLFHQEMCSCRHCCGNSHQQLCHGRSSKNSNGSANLHHGLHPPPSIDSGGSRLRSLHPWSSNELDSGNDANNHHYPRKVIASHGNKQVSLPVAGGAPFLTCCNCLELVKLPRKHISMVKKPQKIKCGACSSVIFLDIGNKEIAAHAEQIPTEIDEGSVETADENVIYWNDDFSDSQHKFSGEDKKANSCDSEGPLNPVPSSSSLSQSPENGLSALSDHCHDSVVENHVEKANRSRGSEDCGSLDRSTSLGHPETDVPSKDHSNGYASQDSVETGKDSQPKVSKVESFLSGFMKKSFNKKAHHNSGEIRESQVFVNGHLIPDRAVKKAEKLAGPIQPGDYWYDNKAGFWGVMGHPCLGIIMPNIEEFNYPIPINCAAGNTGVYVNGRELHQKDLDLLAKRGLPITRNRSYLIEISGEVIDEQTGEALEGLGKLAPTVERAKHGFGMKVSRFISQPQP